MATKWIVRMLLLMNAIFLAIVYSLLQAVMFPSTSLHSARQVLTDNLKAKAATTMVRRLHRNTAFKDSRLEVRDYVIAPEAGFCTNSAFVVIVPVKAGDDVRRREWRSTYARPDLKHKFKYGLVFAVGLPRSPEVQQKLLLESQLYGDIVQADFEDVYSNLTTKVLSALRLVFSYCRQTKAILKIDDDAAWNIVRTKDLVRSLNYNEIYGQIESHPKPHRAGPWHVTEEEWSRKVYPPFCRGMAYVVPRRAAEKILSVIPFQQFLKLEDVFITGVLTEAANITLSHLGSNRITVDERDPGIHKEVDFAFFKINRKHQLFWFWKVNGDLS